MSNPEILTLVSGVTAIVLSVWALIKAHSTPAVAADAVINGVLNNPTITTTLESYGKSISPDVLKMILDASTLGQTLTTGALNMITAGAAQTTQSAAPMLTTTPTQSSAADPTSTQAVDPNPPGGSSAAPTLPTTLATPTTSSAGSNPS